MVLLLITHINEIDRMLLRLYQVLLYLIQPLVWLRLLLRSRKAPSYRKRWAERYGFCAGKVVPGGIMLHSVSVGETLAAIPLVRALRHRYPALPITVTTMTPTGSERVQSAFGKDVHHVYLPYDLPGSMRRFLDQVNPKLVIIMETELWPNMINALHQRKIPLVIANARLSARSAAGYKKIGSFMKVMLSRITLIAAQNQEDGERFINLGLKRSQLTITGSLKFDISVTPELAARAITLRRQWAPHRPVWIATSTHEGEEAILLQAHRELLNQFPNLLLILVPRHPERFSVAKDLTQKAGMSYTQRSTGEIPNIGTQVVIGDTMGELMLLYGIADLAFVGGSLVERGGHNPLEAAAHAIPVLMGPHTYNFKDICNKLAEADGLITISDSTTLVKEITTLLTDEDYRLYHGRQAVEVLHQNQGALQRLLHLLEPHLPLRSQ
jgi:3-deoxy-D-manno-octulosonic-acid transferase